MNSHCRKSYCRLESSNRSNIKGSLKPLFALQLSALFFVCVVSTFNNSAYAQSPDETGYKIRAEDESEFDNQSAGFVKSWQEADAEHEDSVFGELMYNEASTPTKLEVLRLLSKDTPSTMVFMHAISMGLGIDNVLQAAVKYEPSKARDLASSAVSLLPLINESPSYLYSGYELDDLEREDETKPYSVERVIEKYFDDRLVLRPYPDWFDGQIHFMASAAELQRLQEPQKENRWYQTKSSESVVKRPIFVSLYEATKSVLIDGEDRIKEALKQDSDALLPVVFIFNRLNERAISELGYPATIRGVQNAFAERGLMVTPAPEWHLGEYHMYAQLSEFYEIFEIPEEDDFEPEVWDKLLAEAEDYSVTNTSFLMVVLGGADDEVEQDASNSIPHGTLVSVWDDPRSESVFKYASPKDSEPVNLKNISRKGLTFNRPDLIAALNALGVSKVPVAFYYIDNSRVKPYAKGPRALIQAAIGVGAPGSFGLPSDGGGFTPPPPVVLPPASPPGVQ